MPRSSVLTILKRVQKISFAQSWKFFLFLIKKPNFIFPTFRASLRTMNICQQKFGNRHFGHGPENAYRHAYWAYSIACNTTPKWALEFTDYYEKIFINKPRDTQMDLHNNGVGLEIFNSNGILKPKELQKEMDSLYQQAHCISSMKYDKSSYSSHQLIYY